MKEPCLYVNMRYLAIHYLPNNLLQKLRFLGKDL